MKDKSQQTDSSTGGRWVDAIVAVSAANLLFIRTWARLFSDGDYGFYNRIPVTSNSLLALAVNILLATLVAWMLARWRRKTSSRMVVFAIHMGFMMALAIPAMYLRTEVDADRKFTGFLYHSWGLACVGVFGLLVLWFHRLSARWMARVVTVLAPLAAFNLIRILLVLLGIMHLRGDFTTPSPPPMQALKPDAPRVIWMVFDELDYRLVFEKRPPGLQLPTLDGFRNEMFNSTNARPPSDKTVISMPSLISGVRFSLVSFTNRADLAVTTADTGEVSSWAEHPSVFSDARKLGFNTALLGWHLPYPRILGGELNYSVSFPNPGFEPTRSERFVTALRNQWSALAAPLHFQRSYVALHHNMLAEATSLVTNTSYGLVFLHMFPPHLPGLYLPATRTFSILGQRAPGGYLNNLVLLDHDLAALRERMEAASVYTNSWIIISADHSWRGSSTYDGVRDHRVPFLVKPPGPGENYEYAGGFNTVSTSQLVLAVLRGEVQSREDVANWLDSHASRGATIEGPANLKE